ncbi:hypothetical protein FLL45_06505 [Aliikangiella marina]|uniref:Serine aminopeptidase S33 domain-containing protein n=1 Tax=Aliikangiella marina TaxID=1712262 RepID=A0A545TBN8_9GAMM|nr:alpha/beta fold hydrolase [Aliikangiella marina]TQV74611.1 hypothetical protein FLL45_06505 [Aliikangiella marina]
MENVITFGESHNLVGILTPAEAPGDSDNFTCERPVVVILNAGLVNRAGPFRMSTELARELAKQGFHAFRFDLSGIGDSNLQINDAKNINQQYLNDIGHALDAIESKLSTNKFIVLGLCNGADLAHQASVLYEKIIGYVSLDGYGYKNFNAHMQRFVPIVTRPRRLTQAISRKLRRLFSSKQAKYESRMEQDFTWKLPAKSSYIEDMQSMYKKGLHQLLIFTGAVRGYYSYEKQFDDVFGHYDFSKNVEVTYFETADHTYLILAHRKLLFERIILWLNEHFS